MSYDKRLKKILKEWDKYENLHKHNRRGETYIEYQYKHLKITIIIKEGIFIQINKFTHVEANIPEINQTYIKELAKQIDPVKISELLLFLETGIEEQMLREL